MDGPTSRADDVERVHGWLRVANAGRCVVGIVQGEPGAGKSAVAAALRARATDDGCAVLATSGRAADAELGFASLLTLLRPHTGELDVLAPEDAPALRAALALDHDGADAVRVDLGVFRVLAALAERATVLVVVDDADQLDAATAHALAFALGRLDADPVCAVLFTTRPPADELTDVAHERLTLGPMDAATLAAIASWAAPDLSPDVAAEVVRRAAGNPLAARELATSLTADERAGRAALPAVPRPSAAVIRGFEARLGSLSEPARRALVVVAADDTEDVTTIGAALAYLGEPPGGLDEAEAAGLVARAGNRVLFSHPLMRAVAYHQVAPASRRAAHRALAAALDRPDDAAARAWQLAAAADGVDEVAAAALALAAVDAARRGGPASAARTLEHAAALTPDAPVAACRLAAAAREWLAAGEAERAAELVARAGAVEDVDVATATVEVAFEVEGALGAARLLAATAARGARVDALRAGVAWARGDLADARAVAARVVDDADVLAATYARAVLVLTGDAPAVEPVAADDAPAPMAAVEGSFAATCRDLVADARVAAGAVPNPAATYRPTTAREARRAAALETQAGRPLAAVDLLRPLLDLDVSPRERNLEMLAVAENEMLLGRLRADDTDVATAIAAARRRDDALLVAHGSWLIGRARLAVAVDDPVAIEHLLRAGRAYPVRYAADAALALVLGDRDDTARELAAGVAGARGGPLVELRASRAGALARLDVGSLVEVRDQAVAQGYALEAVDAGVAALVAARRHGRPDQVGDALERARLLLRATDARAHAALLASPTELASQPVTAGLKAKLSPAELRVAEAVTSGGTNRQVAETLFLSVKTVDFHLQQIYRKLGVRSRTELAVLVSRDPELAGRTEP
jgi:DNA-binding CsgD family transcriptional regulator